LREAILEGTRGHRDRLIVLCMVADADIVRSYEDAGFLVFEDADRAVLAIGALARLQRSFQKKLFTAEKKASRPKLPARTLTEHEAKALLKQAGIPILPERLARSVDEAVAAAGELGFPVAMKIVSADIAHKSDIGGVLLDVCDVDSARQGYGTLLKRATGAVPAARIEGVLVAPMAKRGVETILGVMRDPTFGPVVLFGLGGVFVEVFKDVTLRLAPFDEAEALAMIREVRGCRLLEGVRGTARSDVRALANALVALGDFAAAQADELESIDINPFLVLPEGQGAVALDALIVIQE
jgi:acyl-CoA synthetase (NDP forming)